MPNVFSHPYQLDESISHFRVVGWYFSFYSNFRRNFCKQTLENLIRRQMVLHCSPMSHKKDTSLIWVNVDQAFCESSYLKYLASDQSPAVGL